MVPDIHFRAAWYVSNREHRKQAGLSRALPGGRPLVSSSI